MLRTFNSVQSQYNFLLFNTGQMHRTDNSMSTFAETGVMIKGFSFRVNVCKVMKILIVFFKFVHELCAVNYIHKPSQFS